MTRALVPVALIVPHTNTVMEPDFVRMGGGFALTTWRIRLDSVTREAEERMLGAELDARLEEISVTRPAVVVFGCTSAGALGGLEHDARIASRIGSATGAEVVTVVGSMVERLGASAPSTVTVLTPYTDELTRSVAGCVKEAGYEVEACGVGLVDNEEIGRMSPEAIVDFARAVLSEGAPHAGAGRSPDVIGDPSPDAVFLSCTNWRAAEALGELESRFGVPVLSSNQVTWAGLTDRITG